MKRHSINWWIIRSFLVMLVVSLALSTAANIREAYVNSMEIEMDWADGCANNVRHLLTHQWSLQDLESSPPDGTIVDAHMTLQHICEEYEFDAVYVYTVDPTTGERKYYVQGRIDQEELPLSYPSSDIVEEDGLTPGERALLTGSRDIQREIEGIFDDEFRLLAPYTDDQGKLLAIIGINDNTQQLWQKTLNCFLEDFIPFTLSMLTGFMILLALVKRRIVTPLDRLTDSMRHFSKDSRHRPEPLNITQRDEIGEIAQTYEKMTEEISEYIHNNEALTRRQAEIDVHLDAARRIQYGLVPEETNLSGDGYTVCAMTHPAKAVGGDFYDCFPRNDGCVCIVMGDVSGKGLSAAIFMAAAKILIREKLMAGLSPSESLNQANDTLCEQNPEGLFVTAFAAVMKPATGELRYANAGHTYPILFGKHIDVLKPDSGIALGLFEDAGIKDDTITLAPSEGILLYTDGLTEAINPQKAFFGMVRLTDALKSIRSSASAKEVILMVNSKVNTFCSGMEPFDDMAVLALKCNQSSVRWRPLPVALSALDEVKKAVFSLVGERAETRRAILACDELIANIVNYSRAKTLQFSCEKWGETLRIAFSDDGIHFDPTVVDIEGRDLDDLDRGGMGLGIIRQAASSIHYRREDGHNISTLTFPLGD